MHRTKKDLEDAVKVSNNYSDVCRYFGIIAKGDNFTKIKKEIKDYHIDVSHFKNDAWNKGLRYITKGITSLEDILIENSDCQSNKLKKRLLLNGIKEYKCECCGNTEWNGQKIPLELHHINGNHCDNRLENLQLLCPNCHALTKNYRGANQNRYKDNVKKVTIISEEEYVERQYNSNKNMIEKICPVCGKKFVSKNKEQIYCSNKCNIEAHSSKPNIETLLKDIDEFGFNQTKIGKKYNVTGGAVRKWLKSYGLYDKKYTYQNLIKRKIAQYDENGNLIKIYDSISDATKIYGLNIKSCLNGKKKMAYNFIWKYYNEDEDKIK